MGWWEKIAESMWGGRREVSCLNLIRVIFFSFLLAIRIKLCFVMFTDVLLVIPSFPLLSKEDLRGSILLHDHQFMLLFILMLVVIVLLLTWLIQNRMLSKDCYQGYIS